MRSLPLSKASYTDLNTSRALQNRAQKLAQQVTSMTARIKELETALSASRLRPQSELRPPGGINPEGVLDFAYPRLKAESDYSGTLGIDQEGVASFYGENSASEVQDYHVSSCAISLTSYI